MKNLSFSFFKKYTTVFFILLFTNLGFGQTEEIDSLLQVAKTIEQDTQKGRVYARLGWLYISRDTDIASRYLDSSATVYNSINYEAGFFNIEYKRALINRLTGNYGEALKQINGFIDYKKSHGDSVSVADALFQKGVIVQLTGDYSEGLKAFYRALAIYEVENQARSAANIHNSIGLIFKNFGQWDKALESYKKAEAIQIKIEDKINLAITYDNIGNIYAMKNDFDTALEYYDKSLKLDLALESSYGIARSNVNIGKTLFVQQKYDKALIHLKNAYEIQKRMNYKEGLIESLATISLLYGELGKHDLSKLSLEEASQLNSDFNIGEQSFHKAYHKYYESQENYKESLHHFKQYSILKDSIFNSENQQVINGLRLQYDSEKKDKEIAEQKLVVADQQLAITENKSKTRLMSILIVSLLSASILLWFLFQQRQKRIQQQLVTIQREQEVRTLESLMEGEEKERFRIAKELHDGVNGDLSAIKFKLSSLLEMNNSVIQEAVTMIDNSCEQVRAISHNLVPPSLKDFNLVEAVDEYCQSMNSIHEPEVHFQHVGNAIDLDKKQEANLFRIIQELVTNSIKHAEAKEINVQLSHLENILQLTVEDNGKGFDPKTVKSDGIGMQNVQSRVDYLNATMDFLSNEKGTSYTVAMDTKNLET